MTIGEVARATGVPQSAIRYYEAVGVMPPPARKNGVRRYDEDAIDALRILRFFRKSGIPIRGLAAIAAQKRGTKARRDVLLQVLQRRITDLDCWMTEAQKTKKLLEQSIACRCQGDTRVCPILTPRV